MILAVTMNPSVDISYSLLEFKLNDVNRVSEASKTAGGKGLNVARVISQMGESVMATGVLGGTVGDYIVKALNNDHIPHQFLRMEQESRNCIAILHEGKQTEILESGPVLSNDEESSFLALFENLLIGVSLVTISGSLPKGLPADFYSELINRAAQKGVPVILDSSGDSLKQTLLNSQKPFAIKPNQTELIHLLGLKEDGPKIDWRRALKHELLNGIEWVILSMGSEGAYIKHREDMYHLTIPPIRAVNPVGSGDSTVAGFAVAVSRKETVENTMKLAMAAGVLNAMEAETGHVNIKNIETYMDLIHVRHID